jgi:CRP/FNR family cyclic AMP-dependent transcriptional regulator
MIAAPVSRPSGRLRRALLESVQAVNFPAREQVYAAGSRDPFLYLVETGAVKTAVSMSSGKSCILDVHGPEDVFGGSCLLDGAREEAAVAIVATRLLRLPRAEFRRMLAVRELAEDWVLYQAGRMRQQQYAVSLMATTDSEIRLAATILMLSQKLGDRSGFAAITRRLTHEDLGQMVGTTRSRVGLFLKRFEASGIVATTSSHLVVDQRRLCAYLTDRGLATAGALY